MLTISELNGHPVLWLENRYLKISVLPGKGADISAIYYKPSALQFLMETPGGLLPPPAGEVTDFLENYEGGWQVLFPNANDACLVNGVAIPFHGEAALLAWEYEVLRQDEEQAHIHLWARCNLTPFQLERWISLPPGQPGFEIRDKVTNPSSDSWPFVWGQHLVLGGNFLEAGCRLELPACELYTPGQLFEPATARLLENQAGEWPMARGRRPGEWIDLREIPGPEIHTHDDLFLTGFKEGALSVSNPRLETTFHLKWDAALFPWLILWQPYGGADLPPLTGIYGLGIEPWVSHFNLADAIAHGQALTLEPGQSLSTSYQVWIEDHNRAGLGVSP